ncbi:sensor histidine kinase [Siphonobacter sp. SORGH_AS_1065]|uniref:sensor histidine kinase n=1 Tax=Siphonobacter sp. SORGH_AS_1065 TaxID=3041795 RepID=UPI0027842780|nr:sensor histidine kinase [Siphonobacter sp. SORGH_AS_1065]MDQ1090191.1 two-component system NarL family sensor kinase [Siphonobacter sp. SORGH_AS_1065]
MEAPQEVAFTYLLLAGIGVMFLLALTVVVFVLVYQRKFFQQQREMHQQEIRHQKEITEGIVQAQENERERIAQDLHDEVGASLSAARLFINQIQYEETLPDMIELAEQAHGVLGTLVQEVRRVSHHLSPLVVEKLGFTGALRALFQQLEVNGLQITHSFQFQEAALSHEQQLALYRIVQEVSVNIIKHAEAQQVTLSLTQESGTLRLWLEDDGKGFEHSKESPASGIGLSGIRARANFLNAKLDINSAPGQGTRVEMLIPLQGVKLS